MSLKISFNFKDLGNLRYSITELHNGSLLSSLPGAIESPAATMTITYQELLDAHSKRIARSSSSKNAQQIQRNHQTALRGFQRWKGKTDTSPVGEELASDFANSLKAHLAELNLSQRSKSDRRSMLSAVHATLVSLQDASPVRGRERQSASIIPPKLTPFERGLRRALAEARLTPKAAALAANISTSALGRWSRGAIPNQRSTATLAKLDRVLNQPEGYLSGLLEETLRQQAPCVEIPYRKSLAARVADNYCLRPGHLSPHFRRQWQQLFHHKTSLIPGDKARSPKGRWSRSSGTPPRGALAEVTVLNGSYYGSANVYWSHVSSYLGYLSKPANQGGAGIEPIAAQSLAWLAVPEKLESYLEFQVTRSNGLRHGGQAVFCTVLMALLHRDFGYVTQSPEMLGELPQSAVRGKSWPELCSHAHRTLATWKASCTDLSRDPSDPLESILSQEEPLRPVFEAMTKLHQIASAAPQGREEATARRDELLLGLLISNPLRKKNLIELTVRADNSGSVYKNSEGQWRIRLRTSEMKNRRTRRTGRNVTYDVAIAPWLQSLMNDYVELFRPVLAKNSIADNLLLSRNGLPMDDLTHRVQDLTRRLIPGSGGFGPQ